MNDLESLCAKAIAATAEPANDAPPPPETTLRERFYELQVLVLGNLYPKMPSTGPVYDRTSLIRVTQGLDDGDAASLGRRTDDWMRLEGIIKQEEGKRAYFLPLGTMRALSAATSVGTLGEVCTKVLVRYGSANPSDTLRQATRALAGEILSRMKA